MPIAAAAILVVALVLRVLAPPLAAGGQPARKNFCIGVLNAERFPPGADPRLPFFVALRELGWVDGQNVVIKEVYADGDLRRLPALAAELVHAQVDVIVAWGGTPPTLAAKQATDTIPIVFPSAGEPVEKGLVASLAHPGGNVTGIANSAGYGKQFEVLKEAVPSMSRVAFLHNPTAFASPEYLKASLATLESQARTLHLWCRGSGTHRASWTTAVRCWSKRRREPLPGDAPAQQCGQPARQLIPAVTWYAKAAVGGW